MSDRQLFLGIDPGADGAYAFHDGNSIILAEALPKVGKAIDWKVLAHLFKFYEPTAAVIEKVGAMPGQGVTSMFSFGFVVGGMHSIIMAQGIPLHLVTPQAWKKVVLAGTEKDKAAAVAHCQRMYPTRQLLASPRCRTPHSGIADAMCIAEYGWRTYGRRELHPIPDPAITQWGKAHYGEDEV